MMRWVLLQPHAKGFPPLPHHAAARLGKLSISAAYLLPPALCRSQLLHAQLSPAGELLKTIPFVAFIVVY